jgi:uncharacterized protein YvpB
LVAMRTFMLGLLATMLAAVNAAFIYIFIVEYTHREKIPYVVDAHHMPLVPPVAAENPKAVKRSLERKSHVLLDAPVIGQHPELYNGCEITALSMLLAFKGLDVSKMRLADEIMKDETSVQYDASGNIRFWGNPNTGFVGDVTGKRIGLGVYHEPLFELLQDYVSDAVNLTGESWDELEYYVSEGFPVIVWTSISFTPIAASDWVSWDSPTGTVKTTFKQHAALMVGYDEDYVYLNDPQTGRKNMKMNKQSFIQTWEAMDRQALSYGNLDQN